MTIDQALEKIVVSASQLGYSATQIAAFAWEVREKLYTYEELTDEVVQDMLEEFF
ncbi:hypothetical protein PMW_95 [Pseudomonas phage phiPMW]|uniref:Uncharacterized protein n=1 Tax=Pseudomonas phage phiPMW TaxID=1815582 RepID=A0A1S5R1D5_9CAUD|nr:hypothetical protein FDG97_gp095 [Pseudomonas phage phiPMW]ANA49220.1 hypothetical protein PMW_95 [Pseudomonas phage phiPMW]